MKIKNPTDFRVGLMSIGFGIALSPFNLLMCAVGPFIGTLIGVLPGIVPVATIAMLLPITYNLSPVAKKPGNNLSLHLRPS